MVLSGWMLYTMKFPPRGYIWALLIIGIAGIIIDGVMVSKFLDIFKRKK